MRAKTPPQAQFWTELYGWSGLFWVSDRVIHVTPLCHEKVVVAPPTGKIYRGNSELTLETAEMDNSHRYSANRLYCRR